MKIELEIPDDIHTMPKDDLDVIKFYMVNPNLIDKQEKFIEWKNYIEYMASNKINKTFVTTG